jgi:hypothetical protein
MDNVQNWDSYINIPSQQTYRSHKCFYMHHYNWLYPTAKREYPIITYLTILRAVSLGKLIFKCPNVFLDMSQQAFLMLL